MTGAEESPPDTSTSAIAGSDSEPDPSSAGPSQEFSRSAKARVLEHPIIAGLVVLIIAALGTFIWQKAPGVIDDFRDFWRPWDTARVDDLRESISDRPYWTGSPTLLDGSFDFLAVGEEADPLLTVTDEGTPLVAYPADLNEAPFRYEGLPVILIGRVAELSELSGDLWYSAAEMKVLGPKKSGLVYAGLAYGASLHDYDVGDIVILRGLLTAIGRTKDSTDVGATAYFTATDSETYPESSDFYAAAVKRFEAADKP